MKRCLNCMQEYDENYGNACPNCGYRGEATQDGGICLAPGTIIQGRYIIGTVIRARDIDIFYNAWDALFERQVQVQEYFPRYCATRSGGVEVNVHSAKKEQYLEGMRLFCGQSKELIRLYKEEDVVTYHAAFQENRTAYAIMDVLEARTLKTWLGGRIPGEQEVLDLMRQAIRAMDKCHKLGIYHGMIGQDTFWITERGNLILKDFGSWRYISGKPGIINYGNVDGEADVFGLAKMFAQIVTGMDTEDEKNLKKGLGSGTPLSRQVIGALKKALSHETKMLDDFRQDLDGKGEKGKGLSLPRWVYIAGAGAAMVAVISVSAFAFVKYGGLEKIKEIELPWGKKETAQIPEVYGLLREDAENRLKEAGFQNIVVEEEPSYGEHDTVVNIVPHEGETCSLDEEIRLIVCENKDNAGREDEFNETEGVGEESQESLGAPGEENEVKVPTVLGMEREKAENELKKTGYSVKVIEEYSDKGAGIVSGQEPGGGVPWAKGKEVIIRVSIGSEEITMESLINMKESAAIAKLESLGLALGKRTETYNDTVKKGYVISQSIAPNMKAKRGDGVNLVISKGKDPVAEQQKKEEAQRRASEEKARKESEEAASRAEEERRESEKASEEARKASEEADRKAKEEANKATQAPAKAPEAPTPSPPKDDDGKTKGPGGEDLPNQNGPFDRQNEMHPLGDTIYVG